MAYYFFLGFVPLPITPGELNINTPSMNKTVTLINDGEINIPKDQGLREISFDFLLPQHQKYPFANYQLGGYTASVLIPMLNIWKRTKLPFQFIVTRMTQGGDISFFTNIKCLIEDFTYRESADDLGTDVECSINLKEYKEYGTKIIDPKKKTTWVDKALDLAADVALSAAVGLAATAVAASVTKTRDSSSKQSPKVVVVAEGDTLFNICKKHLGDGEKYKEIAELNNLESPEKIYVGLKLRME